MSKMTQAQFIAEYNDKNREQFNEELFNRDDQDIIEELKKVLLSCQRDNYFTLRVESFEEVNSYREIKKILYDIEENRKEKGNKKKENQYGYINIKDTDMRLLIVNWYIRINDEEAEFKYPTDREDRLRVVIAVPRIVDKYYFRIAGNIYFPTYQIVDGSVYNNVTSTNAKKQTVIMKVMFMPIKIYRDIYELTDITGETVKAIFYRGRLFGKTFAIMKYIFAKFGLYGAFDFMGVHCIDILNENPLLNNVYNTDEYYIFCREDKNIYITVPRYIFDNNAVVQSIVLSIFYSFKKDIPCRYEDLFTTVYWIKILGSEFNKKIAEEKGHTMLCSLENLYDLKTKEILRLDEEYKKDIYCVLRWLMREFSELRLRNNLDITTKRIRCPEYIASLYAMKILQGLYRISEGKHVKMNKIKQAIFTAPMTLISQITKCTLVNYSNLVSDNDAINVLKFTYKGPSGLGDTDNSAVPEIYRYVHYSNYGIIDMDSSSATDPGLSGSICPLVKLYDGSFSDFKEPNNWEAEYQNVLDMYKSMCNRKEVVSFKKNLGIETDSDPNEIQESINVCTRLMEPIYKAEMDRIDVESREQVVFYHPEGLFEIVTE